MVCKISSGRSLLYSSCVKEALSSFEVYAFAISFFSSPNAADNYVLSEKRQVYIKYVIM